MNFADRVLNRGVREWALLPYRLGRHGGYKAVGDRRQFFEAVLPLVRQPATHMEFGVWQGAGLRWWVEHLSQESRLFGFDSFEGLPTDWTDGHPKGQFSTGGRVPDIAAPNLEFVVGWFENTLGPWLSAHRDSLADRPPLVNFDCDLYAPTALVLEAMKDYWRPGTVTLFDEFWFHKDKYRALHEFCARHGRKFRYVVVGRGAGRVAIEWL